MWTCILRRVSFKLNVQYGDDLLSNNSLIDIDSCISQVKTLCPLCRLPFDKQSCTTLRVDLDVVGDEQSRGTSAEFYEALRLQQAIASVADEGTTEPRLRQLIQECKTFLNGKPRHMVCSNFLYSSHRRY